MLANKEARILQKTFKDKLTVTRKSMYVDPNSGESKFKDKVVYENIMCALSDSNKSAPTKEGNYSKSDNEKVIFTLPGIEMKSNDLVTVVTEQKQTFSGRTGKTFAYISHGETVMKIESMA